MINYKVFEDDLIRGMTIKLASNEKTEATENLDQAIDAINSAIEIFEERGMLAQADACLDVLSKIANFSSNVQTGIPSMEVLFENGLTMEDWKGAMSGNLLGKAKLNQSMRNAGYDEEAILSFLGKQQYLSPSKTQFMLDENVESERNLNNIGDMISQTVNRIVKN